MYRIAFLLWVTVLSTWTACAAAEDVKPAKRYYAHPAVEDRSGVIAPWYRGQNGQCDFRVRIAAETLKRYPWTEPGKAAVQGPHYIFNGNWTIDPDGTIHINPELKDWENGDIGQRSISLLLGLTDYYRYTGDPAALGIITMTADYVLDYCQTPENHPWPRFFISCPTKGKAYYRADPHGFIQLDLSAYAGSGMVAAYKVTGNERYWETAKHWADLLAERCNPQPGVSPWPRYANPQDVPWGSSSNVQTGGAALVLRFLDDVIRTGYRGKDGSLLKARDAGEKYLREALLPEWNRTDAFGHNYWDWDNATYTFAVASYACQYLMNRREAFPDWENDVRNIMSLAFCRLSVNPESMGDVYSGAWAFPEAHNCCGKVLQYPTTSSAAVFARYGALANSEWAKEIARRQVILWTYDAHETGVVEDLIDGGTYVAAIWFNLAHPWPMKALLDQMAWQPELTGASRENHILRSASVVTEVRYGKGKVAYRTFDAASPCEDVLRLAFIPNSVAADGKLLSKRETLSENGYTVKTLPNGDCIVTIRHDGFCNVTVAGDDPQEISEDDRLHYEGPWTVVESPDASGGKLHAAEAAGATASFEFTGNQVRLIGRADPSGGKADVYLDGVKQLCGIDFWSPVIRDQQILCYKNGLAQGRHTLKIIALGAKNPYAKGTQVDLDAVQWSAAQGVAGLGEATGPAGAQRVIFGYTKRQDYVDAQGHAWRPAAEYVLRLYGGADLEPIACWTEPKVNQVSGARDAELYRYGVHGKDITAYFTVDPKLTYYVRIKFCQADKPATPGQYATTIDIQGKRMATDVDIAATAGGIGKPVDLVFNDVRPEHGVIAIRFWHRFFGEAMVQAIEVGPGRSEPSAKPVSFPFSLHANHLANPGFESGKNNWAEIVERVAAYPESEYIKYPQAGLPKPHGGKEALRISGVESNSHCRVYQDVLVDPRATYRASAWVQGVDVRGSGFGKNPADSAGLCIQELDAHDKVVVDHPKISVGKASDFTELSQTFTTSEKTVKVRFLLDTVMACKWDEGHVTYDDCELIRQEASSPNPAADPAPLVIQGGSVFDSQSGVMRPDRTIVIKGSEIKAVGTPENPVALPKNARVIDARGKYIIPGLIDGHAHLVFPLSRAHVTGDELLPLFLANGVTAVRDAGDRIVPQTLIAHYAESHPDRCPRVFTASDLIDGDPPYHGNDIGLPVTDPEKVRAVVEDMAAWKVTTLKIYAKTSRVVGRKAIEEGHRCGLMVTAHLGNYSAQDAVADGIDCLEHITSVFNSLLTPGVAHAAVDLNTPQAKVLVAALARNKVMVPPTLVVFRNMILLADEKEVYDNPDNALVPRRLHAYWEQTVREEGLTPATRDDRRCEFRKYQELTGILFRAGVPLLAGTDTPEPYCPPGFALHQELELLVESGLPPGAALQAATINNARALKQERRLGSIEPGKLADLVILRADPTIEIHNTRQIDAVVRGGRWCDPKLLLDSAHPAGE